MDLAYHSGFTNWGDLNQTESQQIKLKVVLGLGLGLVRGENRRTRGKPLRRE